MNFSYASLFYGSTLYAMYFVQFDLKLWTIACHLFCIDSAASNIDFTYEILILFV